MIRSQFSDNQLGFPLPKSSPAQTYFFKGWFPEGSIDPAVGLMSDSLLIGFSLVLFTLSFGEMCVCVCGGESEGDME